LVCVSSTSVHSLLRKAGTFELCFIVNEAQGFRILHPNAAEAAEAAAAAAAAAAPENAHHAGAAAPGPRPLPAPPGVLPGLEARRLHVTDKTPRSTSARWFRAGPLPVQSQASTASQRKAIGCCPRGGVGAERTLLRLSYSSLRWSGPTYEKPGEAVFGCFTWKQLWVLGLELDLYRSPQRPLSPTFGRRRVIRASLGEGINHMEWGKGAACKLDVLGPEFKLFLKITF
jgi:hypothetical protein